MKSSYTVQIGIEESLQPNSFLSKTITQHLILNDESPPSIPIISGCGIDNIPLNFVKPNEESTAPVSLVLKLHPELAMNADYAVKLSNISGFKSQDDTSNHTHAFMSALVSPFLIPSLANPFQSTL